MERYIHLYLYTPVLQLVSDTLVQLADAISWGAHCWQFLQEDESSSAENVPEGHFCKIFWTFLHLSIVFHMEDVIQIQDDMWHRESTSQSFPLSWQRCTRHHDRFYYSRRVLPSKKKKEKNVFSSHGLLYAKSHQVAK